MARLLQTCSIAMPSLSESENVSFHLSWLHCVLFRSQSRFIFGKRSEWRCCFCWFPMQIRFVWFWCGHRELGVCVCVCVCVETPTQKTEAINKTVSESVDGAWKICMRNVCVRVRWTLICRGPISKIKEFIFCCTYFDPVCALCAAHSAAITRHRYNVWNVPVDMDK